MSPSVRSNTPIPAGAVIGGKYRIDALLAEGGMGVVYRGTHLVLEQTVAIKVVRPELTHRKDAVARFLREARIIAGLRSEHVASVLDSGCIKNGPPYMVLEYLEGADLRTWLQSRGALPIPRAVDLMLQACEALAEAHAQGLVHRDIKPENLFLTRLADGSDCLKVLDFGISKRVESARGRSYTAEGQSLGSPHYMGPEQMSAPADVDARADVWSLGVVMFELVSGRLPFDGESVATVCARVICRQPRPLRSVFPDAPAGLEAIIQRCLNKQPANRYASVCELSEALAPFGTQAASESVARIRRLSGRNPLPSFDLTPVSITGSTPTPVLSSTTEFAARAPRKRSVAVGAALAAALAAIAIPKWESVYGAAGYVVSGVTAAARGLHDIANLPASPQASAARPMLAGLPVEQRAPREIPICRPGTDAAAPISPQDLPLETRQLPQSETGSHLANTRLDVPEFSNETSPKKVRTTR